NFCHQAVLNLFAPLLGARSALKAIQRHAGNSSHSQILPSVAGCVQKDILWLP
ncbi:hypothetical protein Nmel_014652, partial [Mimus melanotis]